MDIGSGNTYPSNALSNFTPHPFVFDGVECTSMEGLLQAFKFENHEIQKEVCKMYGLGAKRRGSKRNKRWKQTQTLYWKGEAYKRDSEEYQELLDRAYEALAQNDSFRRALLASGNSTLTHSIGRRNSNETVLTIREFCGRLTKVRERLQKGEL